MVKINEFFDNSEMPDQILPQIDYDLPEDLLIFMRNDPLFYRKSFFPAIETFKDKGSNDLSTIERMIKQGLQSYCRKFNIPHDKKELLSMEDIKQIANRIVGEDINEIEN